MSVLDLLYVILLPTVLIVPCIVSLEQPLSTKYSALALVKCHILLKQVHTAPYPVERPLLAVFFRSPTFLRLTKGTIVLQLPQHILFFTLSLSYTRCAQSTSISMTMFWRTQIQDPKLVNREPIPLSFLLFFYSLFILSF